MTRTDVSVIDHLVPIVRRYIRQDPSLNQFLDEAPNIESLDQIDFVDVAYTKRALRKCRRALFIYTAAQEARGEAFHHSAQ